TFSGGQFSLRSIDFEDFSTDTVARLTSSTGGSATVSSIGTFTPVIGFDNVDWIRVSFANSSSADPFFLIDNIQTLDSVSVPDSANSLTLLGGLSAAAFAWVRRTPAR